MMNKNAAVKKPKKSIQARGVEALKERYGWICVSPWIFGLIIFFIIPIFQSFYFIFCDASSSVGGFDVEWTGLYNLKTIFQVNPDFTDNLIKGVSTFAYSFPIILVLSLIIALVLNSNFKGRTIFRSIYFLPVIIASGVVLGTLSGISTAASSTTYTDEAVTANMINVSELVEWVGLPDSVSKYFNMAVNSIMNLVWQCGVQIILFIAGMQSIPDLYYEVSKVEGATAWEEFWFITFPSLSRVITLVTVFTMVELMTSQSDPVISQAYNLISSQAYGESSAMLWVYFTIIIAILGALLGAFNFFCAKKWE